LAKSIGEIGLLHAPVVVPLPDDKWLLIAGERRMRAISRLTTPFTYQGKPVPQGQIPVTLLGHDTELARVQAELEENIIREELTWQERTEAIARLHKLRDAEAKAKGKKQTFQDTAKEIHGSATPSGAGTAIREDVFLSDFLDRGEVLKAKTRNEALRIAKRIAARELQAALAEKALIRSTPHQLLEGDTFELLPTVSAQVACVVADPPYGVGTDTYNFKTTSRHNYTDNKDYAMRCYRLLAERLPALAHGGGLHFYGFCWPGYFFDIKQMFEDAGWTVWNTPLIWSKGQGMVFSEYGPRRTYDAIVFAQWGKLPCMDIRNDVIEVPNARTERKAEKPIALYRDLLERSTAPGDTILDPFCGTGNIFVAASELRLTAIV